MKVDIYMEKFYENIKKRREELNMTQDELAKILKYKSRSSINKLELGLNDLPQSKIKLLAEALKTTPAYIMGWQDNPSPMPTNDDELSPKEKEIIKAYREQPDLRVAVERVLGIYNDTGSIKDRSMTFKIASREGEDTIELTPDQRKELVRIVDEAKNRDRDNSDLF